MYRLRSRTALLVGTAVTFAMLAAACSSTGPGVAVSTPSSSALPTVTARPLGFEAIHDGAITDQALTALAPAGVADPAALDGVMAQVAALPADQQLVVFRDAARRYELAAAKDSGLQEAAGGEAAAATAITDAWAAVGAQIDAVDPNLTLQPVDSGSVVTNPAPAGFRRPKASPAPRADAPATPGAVGVVGVLMGAMALATFADPMVSSSNTLEPGKYSDFNSEGISINATTQSVAAKMEFNGPQDGINVHFTAGVVVYPCPTATGEFAADVKLDLTTSKGSSSQKVKITLKIRGQVDDEANLASHQTESHSQWDGSGGSDGPQTLDFTNTDATGRESTWVVNNSSGGLTKTSARMAGFVSAMFEAMIGDRMLKAAEAGWKSGRCVHLGAAPSAGPTGLQPGDKVSVLTTPRSKLDGTPTGGTVTATLAAGGKSITPTGKKVPADAKFDYVAPDDSGKSGSVNFESRSKRGVGKASIDFSTKGGYTASGGTPVSFTGKVPDLSKSFTLQGTGPGFTVTFSFTPSSPTAGALEYKGSGEGVTIKGTGTYTISGKDPDPLTLHYNSNGCATPGGCRANSNDITLTRA